MPTHCNCEDWKPGTEQLNSALQMADIHGIQYRIKHFIYCPWCGRRVLDVGEVTTKQPIWDVSSSAGTEET